ncbi:MAG: type pilus assembly protein PilA [Campylobacterota bacterium]|nr:type pilus assembly protein PilA [Campylobacterota bacterium]
MKFSRAFTVIELVFVIVVLGILAAVALPKFGATREMADIAKGRGDLATIRTAIANDRQARVIQGSASWITRTSLDTGGLFGGVLMSPMTNSQTSGNWYNNTLGDGTYEFRVGSSVNVFTYYDSTEADATKRGKILCTSGTECSALQD